MSLTVINYQKHQATPKFKNASQLPQATGEILHCVFAAQLQLIIWFNHIT